MRNTTGSERVVYSGFMADATSPDRPRRNEQHKCTHCGSRFEVWHTGDPLGAAVQLDVRCPCCGGAHTVSVPRGAEKDLRVEALPGLEPETGVVD
jgi:hypothetical protein